MTQDELDRLEALAKAATPGPWYQVYEGSSDWTVYGPDDDVKSVANLHRWHQVECPDAAFIVAARDAVPALVAEVRRLRALVEAAYREGYDNGYVTDPWRDQSWESSDARKALEGA